MTASQVGYQGVPYHQIRISSPQAHNQYNRYRLTGVSSGISPKGTPAGDEGFHSLASNNSQSRPGPRLRKVVITVSAAGQKTDRTNRPDDCSRGVKSPLCVGIFGRTALRSDSHHRNTNGSRKCGHARIDAEEQTTARTVPVGPTPHRHLIKSPIDRQSSDASST